MAGEGISTDRAVSLGIINQENCSLDFASSDGYFLEKKNNRQLQFFVGKVKLPSIFNDDAATALLLHFDQLPILDSSNFSHRLVNVGSVEISYNQNRLGLGSAYFSHAVNYLAIGDYQDFNFGSQDFTVDFWVNYQNSNGGDTIFCNKVAMPFSGGLCFRSDKDLAIYVLDWRSDSENGITHSTKFELMGKHNSQIGTTWH